MAGSRRTATRVTPGAISLSSSSHFPLMLYSNAVKPGGVAARPRQAVDEAGADRIGDAARTRSARCGSPAATPPRSRLPAARMTSGASATNSAAYLRNASASPAAPADVDPHVAADRSSPIAAAPAANAAMRACTSGSSAAVLHEHADAPHPLALLRPRRERPAPPRRRAA